LIKGPPIHEAAGNMIAFEITLLFNVAALVITTVAAILRPILSYKVIAGLALCATALTTHEVVTGRANVFAPLCTLLLVIAMFQRIGLNLRKMLRR